ncbi:hypothetical protein OL229_04755 [Neisseriaceae bacterium JH1-16]|nr:hypothetical protein [Neisseriaceae bacterium JH1-16]
MVVASYAFRCNACGKCCNTPPQLTVPELFRFESRFIGALALRRLRRPAIGTPLADGSRLTADDVAARARLAERLLFSSAGADEVAIGVQGLDYPSRGHCPVLSEDRLCTLHGVGKPATCGTVPLDALQPDRLQRAVLADRVKDAGFLEADCLVADERPAYVPLVRGAELVDDGYRAALWCQRVVLEADRHYWGNDVYRLLYEELFASPERLARLPLDGVLTIAPVPLLLVLAGVSGRCQQRCLGFVDAQLRLIEQELTAALARKRVEDKPVTQQLRGFAHAYAALRDTLCHPPARYNADPTRAAAIEHWLGLAPCPASAN